MKCVAAATTEPTIPNLQKRVAICPSSDTAAVYRTQLTALVKDSVLAWQLVAKRLGLCYDASVLIAKAFWTDSLTIQPVSLGLKRLYKGEPCYNCESLSCKSYS